MVQLNDKFFKPYISSDKIDEVISVLAAKINADYHGKTPVFVCILNGVFMFAADLLKQVELNCEINFAQYSSYEGLSSTGKVKTILGLNSELEGRDVIIVEDIVDTGETMENILIELNKIQPRSIKIVSLLIKSDIFNKKFKIDYVGMDIPNKFVVGFGLDYNGLGRNLKEIYQLV